MLWEVANARIYLTNVAQEFGLGHSSVEVFVLKINLTIKEEFEFTYKIDRNHLIVSVQ